MEKSKKHTKIYENLKVLNAYIKKIRKNPEEEMKFEVVKHHDSSITHNESRVSERSKRHRRAYNKSRLYEDEQKIFDDILKHKNNQSLDSKLDQQPMHGHLKYNTLLGKGKAQHEKKAKKLKKSEIQANKYYSAPVSTKENGLVTKFKFKNDTQKIPTKKSIEEEEFQRSLKANESGPKIKESDSGIRKSAKDEAHESEIVSCFELIGLAIE